ncbi:phosphoribosyl-AMP cyclohydrolase [Chthonobacter rhizosphaerae]|uniref:phosphoribosyl-AMP cyclohydrolase n=1 Tax=Chthonobacter rhizosphaerae TaxID=2735553 RepID=UPI0015EFBF1B|nr:phosphoribosyl-AMP cyclohydrolase [Chthonobacter rhizosphaerae]
MAASPLFPALASKSESEGGLVLAPRFGADGTITCVTVDADTGAVLMVGHMNAESLALTIETGEGWYWSRSRSELWHKGATSGNVQKVVDLLVDCDQDAVVMRVRVEGHGATCHTGQVSCFYRRIPLGQKAADGPVALEAAGGERRFDPATVYGKP